MATSPPILVWVPGGGVPEGPVSNPPVYSQSDVTQLVEGQAYIDVVFGSIQTSEDWVLATCEVENTVDFEPLNIWPGIITNRTAAGFRLQLNGMPDSGNYYLHWAVSGVNITPSVASTYYLVAGTGMTFTVSLPPSTTVPVPLTVTPDDGGGGSFSPTSGVLTTNSRSVVFTYTPVSYGDITISATNDSGLLDPAPIVLTVVTPTYTLTGPSGGVSGVASTNFTVTLVGVAVSTITVTPGASGGTFTPTTVNLTNGAPSATFTYTPASAGVKTISTTNGSGLTNPGSLTYTATAPALVDGDPVGTWPDSSGNGNDATQSGAARPIYKTAIVNGKPVVRYTTAGSSTMNLTSLISGNWPWTIFAVFKANSNTVEMDSIVGNAGAGLPLGPTEDATGKFDFADRDGFRQQATDYSGAWHVFAVCAGPSGTVTIRVDGTDVGFTGTFASANAGDFTILGKGNGDLAEVVFYSLNLHSVSIPFMQNVEAYLGAKYGITVAGGTPTAPTPGANFPGWWKADAL